MPVPIASRPDGGVRRFETSRSAYRTWPSVRGIGVAVISSTCGEEPCGLRLELVALSDAEAVLLVDDHEAEVGEGDALLEQRVGADDERRHAGRDRLPRGRRAAAAQRTGQQDDVEREVRQQVRQGRVVLPRQQIGRREERGLAAGERGGGQCVGGHGGLARPDVALQQPEHRHGPREVGARCRPSPRPGRR